jgi:hypothetical protein
MEKAYNLFTPPSPKKTHTTRLWALAEEVAKITSTKPNRWLKAGEHALFRALIDFKEAKDVKNKAALLTWLVKKHSL